MRGDDNYTESLLSVVRLQDFVPPNHPLRPLCTGINEAFQRADPLFSQMYDTGHQSSRFSIAPEKLLRAMLFQVFYSICS